MKKILYIICGVALTLSVFSSCNGSGIKGLFGGNDSTEQKEAKKESVRGFDAGLTKKLLAIGEENKLDDKQLVQLIEQFDLVLKEVDAKLDSILSMPEGQDRCSEFDRLQKSENMKLLEKTYGILNHADRQAGFSSEIGNKLKSLNVPERRDSMMSKGHAIVKECK